jgi:dipeptidyl-peptidase-4
MRVMIADAATGDVRIILTEEEDAWIDPAPIRWVDEGRHFIWVSERDGWRHIYLVERNGEGVKLMTPGDFDIFTIQGIDEEEGWLYYIASPENPGQRFLYRVRMDASGRIERVTPQGQEGTNSYDLSPGSRWAFHTRSTVDSPPVTALVRLPRHESVRVLEDNTALKERLAGIERRPTEFFRIDIGEGVELDGWCMKPPDFDPEKRYPVLFYVYSMPAGQTVLDQWGADRHMWHLMMNQRGYIVMSVDSRGTPAPRGRAWRKIIYLKHGIFPAQDQAAAVRAIIKRWNYVDPDRIGVYGWSGGGLMSLLLIFRYPDLYKTSMAGAYLSDHRFYHASFTERFLGLPQDNPEAYRETAALMYAKNLKGNLLLMHGTGDDNVPYKSTEALINELIAHKKRFSLMIYPNRSHGLPEGKNTQYHRYDIYTWYLQQNMPGGGR